MDITQENCKNARNKSLLQILRNDRNGWIVCIVCIVINTIRSGITYTFGLYIAELRKLYGSPMVQLNWIPILISSLTFLLSPLPASFIRLYPKRGYVFISLFGTLLQSGSCLLSSFMTETWWLLITFGVLCGLGSCFAMIASTLILKEFFPTYHEYHEFATSIFQCALPAGLLMFTSVYAWLIETYSWRWSLRAAALKTFVLGTISSLFLLLKKPNFTDQPKLQVETRISCSDFLEILKKPNRVLWLLGVALIFASQLVVFNNLPHYIKERGFSTMESSYPIALLGITELACYIGLSFIGKLLKGKLIYVNIISCLLFSLQFLIWPAVNPSYGLMLFFFAILGVAGALSFGFLYPGSGEVMEMDIGITWTATCTFAGLGTLIGPFISGAVYDYSHSYEVVFYVVGFVCLLNLLTFAFIPFIRYYTKYSTKYDIIP